MSLATSYYSDTPGQHDAIIGQRGSYAQTRANIAQAVKREITMRAGVIDLGGEQRWRQAVAKLEELGVTVIGRDRVRQVGRVSTSTTTPKDSGTSAQSPTTGHPAPHSSNEKSEPQQRQDTNRRERGSHTARWYQPLIALDDALHQFFSGADKIRQSQATTPPGFGR